MGHEQLPVQIAGFHIAGVRQHQPSNPGGGELIGDHASESANAGDQHRGPLELLLPLLAEFGDPHLPFVDSALFVGE